MKPLAWNTLQKAAAYLTGETGEQWDESRVLESGEQGMFNVRFVLPDGVGVWAGDRPEWVGNKPKLEGVFIDRLLDTGRSRVGMVPAFDHFTKRETVFELKPPVEITFADIRIAGRDLEAFARTLVATAPPPDTDKETSEGEPKQSVAQAGWMQAAKEKADAIYIREKGMGCDPSKEAISEIIAEEFSKEGLTVKGKRLNGPNILRHGLKGWARPKT